MSKPEPDDFPQDQEQLERFIDGLMTPEEESTFLDSLDKPEEAINQRERQSEIDASLRRMFKFEPIEQQELIDQIAASPQLTADSNTARNDASPENSAANLYHAESARSPDPASKVDSRRSSLVKLALAASLLVATGLALWNFSNLGGITAHFEPRSLAKLYQETIERGYRPYYNCEDDQRFADTFMARQGKSLALTQMPEGTRMLGLSYLGGISRTTTAMLGEVNSQPVMVFVDIAENREQIVDSTQSEPNLNVFVEEKFGLVFCEVTPLESSTMIQYFVESK